MTSNIRGILASKPVKADLQTCSGDEECASDWCQESSGTCRSPLARDSACGDSDECLGLGLGLLLCIDSKCQDRVGASAPWQAYTPPV